ncbi:MAG: glycoside hydrolase family 2 TIM barrel-domain containing protein, partial [Endomicrobiaceae bacterium]|nr:glycoside hydrolase family 2 TIM barrel-domain containing protein [Endomicrobiaceae bacterium]
MTKKISLLLLTFSLLIGLVSFSFASGKKVKNVIQPFEIYTPGTEEIIDYEKYGDFLNLGTNKYKYVPKDFSALKIVSGEGIYPNVTDIYKNPNYKKMKAEKKLEGDKWNFVNSTDFQANYFKWATAQEDPGVRQYYIALALEQAGNYKRAIKAYHSIAVFFPKATGVTFWKTPWYIAPVAIEKIKYLTREHQDLGIKLVDAEIDVINRFDDEKNNDDFIVNPGKIVPATAEDWILKKADLDAIGIKKTTGKGKVKLVEYNNKHYQLFVDEKPYIVRAICYSPNPVGTSPDNGTLNVSRDWMFADYNKNGIIDGPYESWVDKNKNEKQDKKEKPIGDFQLMKEMGVNTLRLYHYPNFNKDLLKAAYEDYGFMYMIGAFIGMYCTDSGAEWFEGTDYTNPEQCKKMLASVEKMVEEYKDEPYVLMWVLGNENNYGSVGVVGVAAGTGCNIRKDIPAYYKFVNECAKRIKELDPQ